MALSDLVNAKTEAELAAIAKIALQALDVISAITTNPTIAAVDAAFSGINAVIDVVENGITGTVDSAAVTAELDKFAPALASNDATEDAALAAKFPKGE